MASAGAIKGITIKVEGDTSGLAKDLMSVNKQINDTSRALKDVEKALKLDPSNVELLAQKQELLTKQIEQTEEKLELERRAADDAKRALEIGSISQEEYATLQAEVVQTEQALNDLERSAESVKDDLSATGDAAQDAGEKAESSESMFSGWGEAVAAAADVAWTAIQAVAEVIGEATTALANMTVETAQYADDILTLSSTSGVATDTLQALQYGEDLLDVSTGTVTGSITKLIRSMGTAQGTEEAWAESVAEAHRALEAGEITLDEYSEACQNGRSAFQELGVSITDEEGNLRDSEAVFWDVIDALGEIDNEAERDVAAMNILGRSARDLNPLIEAGSEGFEEIRAEAEAAGAIMSEDALDSFNEFSDTMSRLDQGAQAAQRALGGILLPVLNEMGGTGVNLLNEFTNALLDADGDISQLGGIVEEMLPQVTEMIDSVLPTVLDIGGEILGVIGQSLLDNLDIILLTAVDLITSLATGLLDALPEVITTVVEVVETIAQTLITPENLRMIIESGITVLEALIGGLTDAIPDLIPVMIDATTTIVETLIEHAPDLIEAAFELILALAEALLSPEALAHIMESAADIVATLIETARDNFFESLGSIGEWGADMIDSIVGGIRDGISRVASAASDVASTIASYLHFSVPDIGPLADFDESGGDMIRVFTRGMLEEDGTLNRALNQTAGMISSGMGIDYSGQLSGIASQLAGMGATGPIVINVQLENSRLGNAVVTAQDIENYRSGGI